MATGQEAVSFNQIINADRQKKRNEELANRILGKNRLSSAGTNPKAQNATAGSLASRIGVAKRSTSTASVKSRKAKRVSSAPVRGGLSSQKRRPDEERLISALNPASRQATIRDGPSGMSIRGTSGPFVVIGSNFAAGTTAADIQSTIEPMSGKILRCWVTSQHPTVTAEITFAEKWAAENAIANFHNQRADGLILSLRMKPAGPSLQNAQSSSFSKQREQADRQRHVQRGADPTIQDGSYGFGEQSGDARGNARNNRRNFRGRNQGRGGRNMNQDTNEHSLYSDQMIH
ncbi:uncharacterized protein ATNIH1004_003185 [Aspergillus tanneri]|uniref:RRM domain-containing protein n=1 Tax=Aspergillus tanneri TaxID=1220188 RepID=A0A5M9MUC5_9EURO|nr:uncharacterized protein ATNIH1004_003185 [Aspergillus tanneri]KAA8650498.1 hypothetical protein ATNIH1004_003185 [Aspergillus tanneri]